MAALSGLAQVSAGSQHVGCRMIGPGQLEVLALSTHLSHPSRGLACVPSLSSSRSQKRKNRKLKALFQSSA